MRYYFLCAGLLLAGCERSSPFPQQEAPFEYSGTSEPITPALQELSLRFLGREPEPTVQFKDGEYFVMRPEKVEPKIFNFIADQDVGVSSKIRAQAHDDSGIESMVLFEDGVKVLEVKDNYLAHLAKQDAPGSRTYHVQAYARDGGIAKSKGVDVVFSGIARDTPPKVSFALDGLRLMIKAVDEGENSHIKTVILHEDGVPIHTYTGRDNFFFRYFRLKGKTGRHEYHAVIEDHANTVETQKIIVNF